MNNGQLGARCRKAGQLLADARSGHTPVAPSLTARFLRLPMPSAQLPGQVWGGCEDSSARGHMAAVLCLRTAMMPLNSRQGCICFRGRRHNETERARGAAGAGAPSHLRRRQRPPGAMRQIRGRAMTGQTGCKLQATAKHMTRR